MDKQMMVQDAAQKPTESMQPGATANPEVPPELQRIGLAVQKVVYDPKAADGFVQMIQSAGDPIQGIAGAAMVVLSKIMQSAKGIDPQTLAVIAGTAAAAHMAVLAQAAGLVKLDDQTIPAVLQAMGAQGGQEAAPGPDMGGGMIRGEMQGAQNG